MDPAAVAAFLAAHAVPIVKGVLLAVGILVAGWIASKWVNRLTRKTFRARKLDVALGAFLASALQYLVIAVAGITALGAAGIQTTSLVAVFASAGFALGLALQGSLESFAGGVMLLFFRPFDIDHKITAAGYTGTVREIGLFATTLVTADNELVLIPNKEVAKSSIVNSSAQGTLRGGVAVTVAWGTDLATVTGVLLEAAKRSELVLASPAPEVLVTSVTRSLDVTLYVWAKAGDLGPMLHRVRTAVHDALLAAGVELAPGAAQIAR